MFLHLWHCQSATQKKWIPLAKTGIYKIDNILGFIKIIWTINFVIFRNKDSRYITLLLNIS